MGRVIFFSCNFYTSIENGLLNLKQRYLYREEICMMYYSEHHTPWENSDDKSEHIGSVSFILCTFVAHIHIYLHPLNNKGKQGISMAWFVIISELERNLGKHILPGICNAPYPSHTLVFSIPEHTHSQTFWAAEETSHGSRRQRFYFLKFRM